MGLGKTVAAKALDLLKNALGKGLTVTARQHAFSQPLAVMRQPAPNNTLHYFVDTTFNYPTMAEGYRVAAINGMNRVSR